MKTPPVKAQMLRAASTALLAAALAGAQTPPPAAQRPHPPAAAAATPAPARAVNPRELKFPPLHPVELAKAATFTLSNGMKLLLLEDRQLPVINGEARVRTGNVFDPPGKSGVATMTGVVMRTGGTRDRNGEQLDRVLEDVAGSVDSSIDESFGQVSFSSLAENATPVLEAFRDVLTAPAFRMDKVDLAKLQFHNLVAHRNDDPNAILRREFLTVLYGDDTPYGRGMEHDDIDHITRGDLQAFHKRYFFPKNVTLAVWGDFETAKMKDQLEQLFAGWTVEQPAVLEFPKVTAKPAPGIFLAKKVDLPQTLFAVGHLDGRIDDKDFPALTIMADILGGGYMSRLSQQVRVHLGYASNITAEWRASFDHAGYFWIYGASNSLNTASTLKAIREEIDKMCTAEVSDDELRFARDAAINSLIFAFDTRRKVLDRMLTYEYFGYPQDFLRQHEKALAAVTRADILRVAKQYLRPPDLTQVVVGNPEEFVPPLDTLGLPVREIDLTIPAPKAHAVSTDAASLEQGKRILARLQQAVGGAEKLAGVKDYTAVREVRFTAATGGATVTETERWMAPGNVRVESESATGKNALYTDGSSGWIARGRNSTALVGAPLKGAQASLFRVYVSVLLSDRVTGRTISALDDQTIEIATPDGITVQVAVSPETGLPLAFTYQAPVAAGPPVLVQESFTQFGEAGGIKFPFQFSTKQNGNLFSESFVKEYKVNSGLMLPELERRP